MTEIRLFAEACAAQSKIDERLGGELYQHEYAWDMLNMCHERGIAAEIIGADEHAVLIGVRDYRYASISADKLTEGLCEFHEAFRGLR